MLVECEYYVSNGSEAEGMLREALDYFEAEVMHIESAVQTLYPRDGSCLQDVAARRYLGMAPLYEFNWECRRSRIPV